MFVVVSFPHREITFLPCSNVSISIPPHLVDLSTELNVTVTQHVNQCILTIYLCHQLFLQSKMNIRKVHKSFLDDACQ